MSGEKQAEEINIGGATAKVVKLDGGIESLAAFLGELFNGGPHDGGAGKLPSGAQMLSEIPPALPSDAPEDAEWKAKHLARLQDFLSEVSQLDLSRVDTFVLGYRLHQPAKDGEQEGFYVGGGHLGTADAIQALLVHGHDRLKAEVDGDYDKEAHDRRVAAGEQPCIGCGRFHD